MGQLLPFRPRRPGEDRRKYEMVAHEHYERQLRRLQKQWVLVFIAAMCLAVIAIAVTGELR